MRHLTIALLAMHCLCCFTTRVAARAHVILRGQTWSADIDLDTAGVTGRFDDGSVTIISAPATQPAAPSNLIHDEKSASWRCAAAEGVTFTCAMDGDALLVKIAADQPGSLQWPVIAGGAELKAFILPMFEGVYVPIDDGPWAAYLQQQGGLNTTADLSMPFLGIDVGRRTLTYLIENPFNNELTFDQLNGRLRCALTHTFTRNRAVKQFSYRIVPGDASPIAPAKIYRDQLIAGHQFVSLTEKIRQTPNVAKLLGAAHIYLWGDGLLGRDDIIDYRQLAKTLTGAAATQPSPARSLWNLLSADARQLLKSLPDKLWIDNFDKGEIVNALDEALHQPDFDAAMPRGSEPPTTMPTSLQERCKRLADAMPGLFKPVNGWGDGYTPKMIEQFAAAGLDRLWIGSPNWKGLADHPEFVRRALAAGYLVGPYDSYDSVHSPTEKQTWETAQFDQQLYDTGGVTKADGTIKSGFQKKGHVLSPLAAEPYVHERVGRLVGQFKCNSWFMDCDAFGDLYDDYSPAHSATQEDDQNAKLARLKWITNTFGAVVGSEGGSAFAAPAIAFAHGMETPVIGWGDPDLMTDKRSKYYLGAYYPPEGPAVFFKQVPMKPEYKHIFSDPRFRLPLYQIVFHDSVIATHHWSGGSFKYEDPDCTRELLELLYDVPPLYHINPAEWSKRVEQITAHYAFWSALHRRTAELRMTNFKWLNAERTVQQTTIGDELEMTANFSATPFQLSGKTLPAHAIQARWIKTDARQIYPTGGETAGGGN